MPVAALARGHDSVRGLGHGAGRPQIGRLSGGSSSSVHSVEVSGAGCHDVTSVPVGGGLVVLPAVESWALGVGAAAGDAGGGVGEHPAAGAGLKGNILFVLDRSLLSSVDFERNRY